MQHEERQHGDCLIHGVHENCDWIDFHVQGVDHGHLQRQLQQPPLKQLRSFASTGIACDGELEYVSQLAVLQCRALNDHWVTWKKGEPLETWKDDGSQIGGGDQSGDEVTVYGDWSDGYRHLNYGLS